MNGAARRAAFGGGAIAASLLLAAAQPARAGEASCIWDHFPPVKRALVLTHEVADMSAALQATFTDQEFAASLTGCGVTPKTEAAANAALNAYALRLKTEKQLLASADLTPDRLDAAWASLDAATKSRLARHTLDTSAEEDAVYTAVQLFADRVGLKGQVPDAVGVALTSYLRVRAALSVYEPQF